MNQTYVLLKPHRSYFFLSFFFNEKKEDLMLRGYFCFSVKKSLADIFFSDINECAVSKGRCSHKCVTTAGGHKCECPDPKLNLSSDNKTCYGNYHTTIQFPVYIGIQKFTSDPCRI